MGDIGVTMMAKAWSSFIHADRGTDAAPARPANSRPVDSRPVDWRRRMSNHIAYALLVYTVLQIFVTMGALKSEGPSLLPYIALIVLVVAIIPSCRGYERRWNRLSDEEAAHPALASHFRHDRMMLWALAVGLPFVISGAFLLLARIA